MAKGGRAGTDPAQAQAARQGAKRSSQWRSRECKDPPKPDNQTCPGVPARMVMEKVIWRFLMSLCRASPVATLVISCLWAPPVATQFSVVRARQCRPLWFHIISSHHFSGHRLWRISFLFCRRICFRFGHRQWRPFYILHLISSHFSEHRLWRLSFLFCHILFSYQARAPPVATLLHIAFDFIASFIWAPPVATQFSVLSYIEYIQTYIQA